MDEDNNVAVITLGTPTGVQTGDVCDIYRLGVDRPELIVQGAAFGSVWVDPYPTVGEHGGHRVVYRTVNGDYTTATREMAWIDLRSSEGDILDLDSAIIDFDDGQIVLDHNISLSNAWKKDFEETQYLGGSVQGDWNPAVSRTLSMDAVSVVTSDPETIQGMRRLSVHAGICHVRTPEGSSFACDIQVSESIGYDSGGQIASFSLSITRVDPEELDGTLYADWYADQEEEEYP
jgi:hypothetical protein